MEVMGPGFAVGNAPLCGECGQHKRATIALHVYEPGTVVEMSYETARQVANGILKIIEDTGGR